MNDTLKPPGRVVKVTMPHRIAKTCAILLCSLAFLISLHAQARAETDSDLQTLEMFYEGKDLVVSATRNPKPLSQTAENITVITSAEIEMMGAHTLADVLNNVPGIQIDDRGSVGTFSGVSIQGANFFHILFLLDGVTLNFLSDGSVDFVTIPVQFIEQIEIIKGPGSSSWGSALGGVVNIVTKSPNEEKKLGGALSFSAGERGTRDSRGEATGTLGSFGYYLYAGNLTSSGMRPHTNVDENNLYAKLRWELPGKGSILSTLAYTKGTVGAGQADIFDLFITGRHNYFVFTPLSLNYPLNDKVDFDFSIRTTSRSGNSTVNMLSSGDVLQDNNFEETTYGGSAKFTWRERINTLVAGGDYDHGKVDTSQSAPLFGPDITQVNFRTDKWGLFINDTVTLGSLAITPGIRYDQMRQVGDFFSPSLGVAWSLNDQTVLRAYTARGYSLGLISPGTTQEKVVTILGGIETTQIPYLWFKTTLFLNYISDHQSYDENFNPILVKHKKQGVEVEAKTVPLFNTSLSAGYTFIDAKNRDTGARLVGFGIPRQIVKLGLHYNYRDSFRASLLGRYVWWNALLEDDARDNAIIWDLNLAQKVLAVHDTTVEIFFSGHNIFNGAQYSVGYFKNARRWLEGGIRFNF